MKKTTYIGGKIAGAFYNSNELLAHVIIHRRTPKDIEVLRKVKYGDGERETMDIIRPRDKGEKRPLLIYIHGGGWISGNTYMRNTYCTEYVKNGYVCANIDYAYAPSKTFPYQIEQLCRAIDFVFDHADEYGIDTSRIVLAGESAGGYFIFYFASLALNPSLLDKLEIKMRHISEFKPRAIISNCGAIDPVRLCDNKFPGIKLMLKSFCDRTIDEIRSNTDDIKLMTPQITKDFPATMLITASQDQLRYDSYATREIFEQLGVPYATFEAKGLLSQHAFPLALVEKQGRECFAQTLKFITPYVEMRD